MPAAYVLVLLLWYAYYGVLFSFSLGLVFLALLPLTLLLGRSAQFVKELTPFIVLLMSYEALQGVAGSLTIAPVIHPTSSAVSYGVIQAVQSAFLSPDLTDATSLLYGLHFPLVIGSAILLLVLQQNTLQKIRLLTRSMFLRFARLLHSGPFSPAPGTMASHLTSSRQRVLKSARPVSSQN